MASALPTTRFFLRVASPRPTTTTRTTTTTTTSRPSPRLIHTTTPLPYRQPRVPCSAEPIPSASGPSPPHMPPYPYGPSPAYHQANTGLYGGSRIRFGHNVAPKYGQRTRRSWRPNVHHKRLWSAALGVFVRTRVTARVLRTVDKAGGLDEYLLGDKAARVKELGPWGWRLRWRLMQTPVVRERMDLQRVALGLAPLGTGVTETDATAMTMLTEGVVARGEEKEAKMTAAEMIAETDELLKLDREMPLEKDADVFVETQAGADRDMPKDEDFMREEKPVAKGLQK